MKNDFILIPFFLLIFIVVFITFTSLNLFLFWIDLSNRNIEISNSIFSYGFWFKFEESFSVALLLSIILVQFRILMKPGTRFLSFVILLLLSFFILIIGIKSFTGILNKFPENTDRISNGIIIVKERINPLGRYLLYPMNVKNKNLESVVIADKDAKEAHLRYTDKLNFVEYDNRLMIRGGKNTTLSIEKNTIQPPPFSLSENNFIKTFQKDISSFNNRLMFLAEKDGKKFYILSFAIVFVFIASGVFMRITRWPLFNLLISFLILRGYFSLYAFLTRTISGQFSKYFGKSVITELIPEYVVIALGILFLLFDIIFIPFDRWKREIEE